MKTHSGVVAKYDRQRGFGFIRIAPSLKRELNLDMDKDLFVHRSAIVDLSKFGLLPDQRVTFKIGSNQKGPCAIEVRITEDSEGLERFRD